MINRIKKIIPAGQPAGGTLLLVCCLAFFSFLQAGAGGVIRGTVTGNPGQQPLTGAHVMVAGQGIGDHTDQDGHFLIRGIVAGKVVLRVTFVGYEPAEKRLTIKDGESVKMDFTLEMHALTAPEIEIQDIRTRPSTQEVPVRMEVITAQSISNTPGQNIVASLDFLSGVNLNSTMGIYSGNTVVSLRGLSGNDQARTLVLLDDVPLNKADAGSVNWNLVNRENVERIEVTKGPGAARYGSGAMGGVINIITKRPAKFISGMVTADYGTFNTAGIRYQVAGKPNPEQQQKGFSYTLNGFYRRSDGYNPEIPEYLEPYDTFYVNNYLREVSVGGKAGYQFNLRNSLEIGADFFNDKRGRGVEIYEIDGAYERHKTLRLNARYRGGIGKVRWNVLLYSQDEHFERLNEAMQEAEYSLYLVRSNRIDRGGGAGITLVAAKRHELQAGLDFQSGSVDGQDIYYTSTDLISNEGKMDTWALFIQDEALYMDNKLQFNLGLRMNAAHFRKGSFRIDNPSYAIQYLVDYQDSAFAANQWYRLDPKFSVQYRFTPLTRVYLSVAQGFRAPNLDDLCRTGKIRNGFKVANPALGPEVLTNYETGTDLMLWNKLHLAASLFYSVGKDFMYYVSTGDSVNMGYKLTPVFKKQNISKVEITGVELDAGIDPLKWLSVFANYTYNHSVISSFIPNDPETDKDLTGKHLTDVPAHKASAGVTVKNKILNFNILWKYTGTRYINDLNETDYYLKTAMYPAYQTFGIRVWHTFFKRMTAAVNVENIFDVRYIDDRLQQNPGRMITFEVTATF